MQRQVPVLLGTEDNQLRQQHSAARHRVGSHGLN